MSKKISDHQYSFSIGDFLDYEEPIVDIYVNIEPNKLNQVGQSEHGGVITYSNDEPIARLQMEEGRERIKIELERFPEIYPRLNYEPVTELHLYLDEFIEALEKGKKLLLNEK